MLEKIAFKEEAVMIGAGAPAAQPGAPALAAILTQTATADPDAPVFVLLNAGIVQRVGPSRVNVTLARRLASLGISSIRFDHGGKGDSNPRRDTLGFEEASIAEARAVIDWTAARLGRERFVLVGLCSGAVTAFKAACQDPRIVGAVMLNGQVYVNNDQWNRHVFNQGWMRWYLTHSLFNPRSWLRALSGRIHYRRLALVVWQHLRAKLAPPREVAQVAEQLSSEVEGLVRRGTALLLVYAEGDRGLDYLEMMLGGRAAPLEASGLLRTRIITGSDHTFSLLANQRELLEIIESWAGELIERARPAGRMAG